MLHPSGELSFVELVAAMHVQGPGEHAIKAQILAGAATGSEWTGVPVALPLP